uniref:Uncharacterized protein n=1 Tax=Latimeria chalumnae TaxID=7897 RepID=H3A6I6_LATCH
LLMGRRTMTLLPIQPPLLEPRLVNSDVGQVFQLYQARQSRYYNRGVRELPPLRPGQRVYMRREKEWRPAVVVRLAEEPQSYMVEMNGQRYHRNRRDLRPMRGQIQVDYGDMDFVVGTSQERSSFNKESESSELMLNERVSTDDKIKKSGRIIRKPIRYRQDLG